MALYKTVTLIKCYINKIDLTHRLVDTHLGTGDLDLSCWSGLHHITDRGFYSDQSWCNLSVSIIRLKLVPFVSGGAFIFKVLRMTNRPVALNDDTAGKNRSGLSDPEAHF